MLSCIAEQLTLLLFVQTNTGTNLLLGTYAWIEYRHGSTNGTIKEAPYHMMHNAVMQRIHATGNTKKGSHHQDSQQVKEGIACT